MKKFVFFIVTIVLLSVQNVKADTINVSNSDYTSVIESAADGDVLVMEAGTYSESITFPTDKTITFKAADDAGVTITFQVTGTTSATNGGLIFDSVTITPSDNYFVYGDMGDIKILAFRNCTIDGVGRCILRTKTEGYTIDEIEFTNCIISNCGDNAYNFIYPKHAVKKVTTTNCTMYNYTNGESFFYANATATDNVLDFTFESNTVYKWAKSSDRAICNVQTKYSTESIFTFRNNIITEPGVEGVTPKILNATGGTLVSQKNLIVNYGAYSAHLNATSQTIDDLTLDSLGLTSIGFPDPDNGDFTISSSSVIATAGTDGSPLGDPRWITTYNNAVTLTTSVNSEDAGSVVPTSASYESGDTATVTATANYGYEFKEWQDSTGTVVSTENPYSFVITEDVKLIAVFSALDMYTLTVNLEGDGAKWGGISLSPEEDDNAYEAGTIVDIEIVENGVTSFLYWEDASTETSREIQMNNDTTITATFDVIPFITGWDFADETTRSNRPGDYYYKTDNTGFLNIYEADGTQTSWGASTKTFGGITYNCARRYTDAEDLLTAPRYFEAKFSGEGYSSIKINSKIGIDNTSVHKIQKMQYSTNGTDYTDLVSIDVSDQSETWIDCNASLPDSLTDDEKEQLYIRWIPDIESDLLGEASSTEGFYLTQIYVYAEEEVVNDTIAPTLVSSVPADGSSTASANGSIVLTFDEKMMEGTGSVVFNGDTLTPVFGSKTVSYAYSDLSYGTSYTITIPADALTDISGNAYAGTTIQFSTMERPEPIKQLYDAVVAADGSGDYTTVQAAIDDAPTDRTSPWLIFIKNGTYEELIRISEDKPYMYLIGQDKDKVILTYKINCSSSASDTGWDYSKNNYGESDCAMLVVSASDFYAENISFENGYGVTYQSGPQALALKTNNDKFAFYNCKMRSYQDTWQTTTNNASDRHYAYDCYIEGAVDYVYGGGDVFLDECTLYNVRSGSVIVAPSHYEATKYGYVFNSCTIDGNSAADDGNLKLGRPWKNYPVAVYLNSTMNVTPAPEGWTNMGVIPKLFAEYNSMDSNGDAIDLSNRKTTYISSDGDTVSGLQAVLTQEEAAEYTYENVVTGSDEWNPKEYFEPVNKPSNLILTDNQLSWDDVQYAICYVITRDSVVIGFTTESCYTDTTVIDGETYTYKVQAANEYGSLSEFSDTVNNGGTGDAVTELEKVKQYVYVNQSTLNAVNVKPGSILTLYSINGSIVFKDKAEATSYSKNLDGLRGIYILRIDNSTYKVAFNCF